MESDYLIKTLNSKKIESFKIRKKNRKKNKKENKIINNILKNILIFPIFLISYYLYYLSLEKC
jgi:hypothetical protein